MFDDPAPTRRRPANLARFNFLDPRARDFYPDRDGTAGHRRRAAAHRSRPRPARPDLTNLVGELATRSEEFRDPLGRARRPAAPQRTKTFHHPVVGRLELAYDAMELPPTPG